MLSLGGQAAGCCSFSWHPLSTIKIISQELKKQLKDQKDVIQDIELLSSQVERCNEILKKLSLNPTRRMILLMKTLTMKDYLKESITSFEETSSKEFIFNFHSRF